MAGHMGELTKLEGNSWCEDFLAVWFRIELEKFAGLRERLASSDASLRPLSRSEFYAMPCYVCDKYVRWSDSGSYREGRWVWFLHRRCARFVQMAGHMGELTKLEGGSWREDFLAVWFRMELDKSAGVREWLASWEASLISLSRRERVWLVELAISLRR